MVKRGFQSTFVKLLAVIEAAMLLLLIGACVDRGSSDESSQQREPGLALEQADPVDGLHGAYVTEDGDAYTFSSTYVDGVLRSEVHRPDGSVLAAVERTDGASYAIDFDGKTAVDAATTLAAQDIEVLRGLPLEMTCAETAVNTRLLRYALQLPLIELEGRKAVEPLSQDHLDAISPRCSLQCDEVTPGEDLLLACGQGIRAISTVNVASVDGTTTEQREYLSHGTCYGACGWGCVGCDIEGYYCEEANNSWGARAYVEYNCYSRDCCESHDACLRSSSWGMWDVRCHDVAQYEGCGLGDAAGLTGWYWDSYSMDIWERADEYDDDCAYFLYG